MAEKPISVVRLDAIRKRLAAYLATPSTISAHTFVRYAPSDIKALLAEVDRLGEENKQARDWVGHAIGEKL